VPNPVSPWDPRPIFRELYKCAFQGLNSQYERYIYGNVAGGRMFITTNAPKNRLGVPETLRKSLWNSACEAYELFEEQETIENFNQKVHHGK
jgi:hypothetical protein